MQSTFFKKVNGRTRSRVGGIGDQPVELGWFSPVGEGGWVGGFSLVGGRWRGGVGAFHSSGQGLLWFRPLLSFFLRIYICSCSHSCGAPPLMLRRKLLTRMIVFTGNAANVDDFLIISDANPFNFEWI